MMLGLGALFVSWSSQYAQEAYSLLFGEVFGVSADEVLPILVLGARVGRRDRGHVPAADALLGAARGRRGARGPSPPDGARVPARDGAGHQHDRARGGRAADVQPDDRPGRRGQVADRPAGPGHGPVGGASRWSRSGRASRSRTSPTGRSASSSASSAPPSSCSAGPTPRSPRGRRPAGGPLATILRSSARFVSAPRSSGASVSPVSTVDVDEPAEGLDQPVPAPARGQPGGLVALVRGGLRRGRPGATCRSCSRSATPPATGAT